MNSRSGVSRLRAQAVLPENGLVLSEASVAMPHCASDYAAGWRRSTPELAVSAVESRSVGR
jgi:hypothetical protein